MFYVMSIGNCSAQKAEMSEKHNCESCHYAVIIGSKFVCRHARISDHAFRHLWFGNQFNLLIYFTLANMTRLMTSLQFATPYSETASKTARS